MAFLGELTFPEAFLKYQRRIPSKITTYYSIGWPANQQHEWGYYSVIKYIVLINTLYLDYFDYQEKLRG